MFRTLCQGYHVNTPGNPSNTYQNFAELEAIKLLLRHINNIHNLIFMAYVNRRWNHGARKEYSNKVPDSSLLHKTSYVCYLENISQIIERPQSKSYSPKLDSLSIRFKRRSLITFSNILMFKSVTHHGKVYPWLSNVIIIIHNVMEMKTLKLSSTNDLLTRN